MPQESLLQCLRVSLLLYYIHAGQEPEPPLRFWDQGPRRTHGGLPDRISNGLQLGWGHHSFWVGIGGPGVVGTGSLENLSSDSLTVLSAGAGNRGITSRGARREVREAQCSGPGQVEGLLGVWKVR